MGWLQDWSSDFSLKHLNPIETLNDPHKAWTEWGTKGFQRNVGPIALDFVPVVGPALSAGARAEIQHTSKNPSAANYQAPDSSTGAELAAGVTTVAATSGSTTPSTYGALTSGSGSSAASFSPLENSLISSASKAIDSHYSSFQSQQQQAASVPQAAQSPTAIAGSKQIGLPDIIQQLAALQSGGVYGS